MPARAPGRLHPSRRQPATLIATASGTRCRTRTNSNVESMMIPQSFAERQDRDHDVRGDEEGGRGRRASPLAGVRGTANRARSTTRRSKPADEVQVPACCAARRSPIDAVVIVPTRSDRVVADIDRSGRGARQIWRCESGDPAMVGMSTGETRASPKPDPGEAYTAGRARRSGGGGRPRQGHRGVHDDVSGGGSTTPRNAIPEHRG